MDATRWLAIVAIAVSACGGADASRSGEAVADISTATSQPENAGRAGSGVDTSATATPGASAPATSAPPAVTEPLACPAVIDGAELLSATPPSVEQLDEQVGLMRELHADTVLIWEEFGIQPNHVMVDGLPLVLIGFDEVGDRCEEIVAAVDHPDLVRVVRRSEEDDARLHEHGSPPWRRLIEAEIGSPRDADASPKWTEMGTSIHGVTTITLHGGEEALAAELHAKYGPLVELRVGNFAYDPRGGTASGADICIDLPDHTARSGLLVGEGRLLGDLDGGRVLFDVVNTGPETVHIVPERIVELTDPGGNRRVTQFTGMMTAEGRPSIAVPAGATETVAGTVSLEACDPSHGTALRPGPYDATLVIRVFDTESGEGDLSDEVLIGRLAVELTDQPD